MVYLFLVCLSLTCNCPSGPQRRKIANTILTFELRVLKTISYQFGYNLTMTSCSWREWRTGEELGVGDVRMKIVARKKSGE
jgi:hypothetical protein